MKTRILLAALASVLLLVPLAPVNAAMLEYSVTQFTTTNVLKNATTYTIATNATNPILIPKDRGLALTASLTPAGATNVATLYFDVAPDLTNWATATPHLMTYDLTSVGTNYVIATNLTAGALNNFKYLRFRKVVTANTNEVAIAVFYSRHY